MQSSQILKITRIIKKFPEKIYTPKILKTKIIQFIMISHLFIRKVTLGNLNQW